MEPQSRQLQETGRQQKTKVGLTRFCINEWEKLTSDRSILDTIQGYQIEFSERGPPSSQPYFGPISFSDQEENAITVEIESLLAIGAISRCNHSHGEFISHIFARPKRDSMKLRVILNLKYFNKHVAYNHFKMEHLDSVINLIQEENFFASLDLSDAYFSIPIAECDKKYLRFIWNGELYQYEVLCFGLATAPRVFTKCTKPIIAHLRKMGFKISIYIDDMIIIHEDPHTLSSNLTS